MMQSEEAERFAAHIQRLKNRAGTSFEELARRTGISSSSLHRYCSGTKIPTGYGVVHTVAKACGASSDELRELHRLWALADAARSASTEPDTLPTSVSGAPPPRRRSRRRRLAFATVMIAVPAALTAGVVAWLTVTDEPESGATAPVRVFNVEEDCRKRGDRPPGCSIGLAINPRRNYDAHNVVSHRVWHGDAVNADCILYDGDEVTDEIGTKSTRWYRVRLNDVPSGHAWLSGIRTRDNPALPTCVL